MKTQINQNRTKFSDQVRKNIQNLLSAKIGEEFVKYLGRYYVGEFIFYKFNIDFKNSLFLYEPEPDWSEHHFGCEAYCEQFLEDVFEK